MDIFRFINSRDIRYHLKKIDYQFNTCEAAWLVGRSLTATLRERFDAWEEIIAAMPDCAPPRPQKTAPQSSSFHALLREYMALLKKKLAWFCDGEGAVYQYELETTSEFFFDDSGMYSDLFSDLESCLRECMEEWDEWEEGEERGRSNWPKVVGGTIIKRSLRGPDDGEEDEKRMKVKVNRQGELLSLCYDSGIEWSEHEREIENLLSKMWIDFPTPFERGDILINIRDPQKPFVLSEIITWDSQRLLANGFLPEEVKKREASKEDEEKSAAGEGIDYRSGKGYWTWGSEGADYWPSAAYWAWYIGGESELYMEREEDYMELERWSGPLKGKYRVLQPVSCFLKEWVSEGCMDIGLLCNAFALIKQEEQCKAFQKSLDYMDEVLEDYGVAGEGCEKG